MSQSGNGRLKLSKLTTYFEEVTQSFGNNTHTWKHNLENLKWHVCCGGSKNVSALCQHVCDFRWCPCYSTFC